MEKVFGDEFGLASVFAEGRGATACVAAEILGDLIISKKVAG